jgi:predicted HAD superfamily Cof-like phosphohydrolase
MLMTKLSRQVREFHKTFGAAAREKPSSVTPEEVRLRAKLIMEEAIEIVEAMGAGALSVDSLRKEASLCVSTIMSGGRGYSLVDVAVGLADLDYVVEGARLVFGIDGGPIADIVHAANMWKVGGPRAANGKVLKPEGWNGPEEEIEKELRLQTDAATRPIGLGDRVRIDATGDEGVVYVISPVGSLHLNMSPGANFDMIRGPYGSREVSLVARAAPLRPTLETVQVTPEGAISVRVDDRQVHLPLLRAVETAQVTGPTASSPNAPAPTGPTPSSPLITPRVQASTETLSVDGPDHYLRHPSGVEPIDIVEWLTSSLANVIEYVWRAPYKGEYEKDMKKALWYAEREEMRLRKHSSDVRILVLSTPIVERMRKVMAAEENKQSTLCRVLAAVSQVDPTVHYEEYHGGVTAPPMVSWADIVRVRDILREVVKGFAS